MFELRNKQDVKVGNFVRYKGDEPISNHFVVVRSDKQRHYPTYIVWVDDEKAFEVSRYGTGRNLTWNVDNTGSYGGTLANAVERGVASFLYSKDYAAEENAKVARITKVLPYVFPNETEALDYAFASEPGAIGNVPVVGRLHGSYYVGFYDVDQAEAHKSDLEREVPQFNARVYGRLDPRAVIAGLQEHGIQAHFNAEYTGAQIYDSPSGALEISKDGDVDYDTWGNERTSRSIASGKDVEQAVAAARLWYYQRETEKRAMALLDWLNTEVPLGVAHFAVEQVKQPLRVLANHAYTIDFNYGR